MFRPDLGRRRSLPYRNYQRPLSSSIVRDVNYQTYNPNHAYLQQSQIDKKRYTIISHQIPNQLLHKRFVKVDQKVNYGRPLTKDQLARVIQLSNTRKPLVEAFIYGDPKAQPSLANKNKKVPKDDPKTKAYIRQPIDVKLDQKTPQFCGCGEAPIKNIDNLIINKKPSQQIEQNAK